MSQLTDNLSAIAAIKSDIRAAIESKGVSMSGVSFGSYAAKIGEIETGGTFVTESLNVTDNGTYTPGQGVDGYSQVTVNVPQSVTGFTQKDITEGVQITDLSNSAVSVHECAFINDSYLRTVNLRDCKTVGSSAFYSCRSLTDVSLPNCLSILDCAFFSCHALSSVFIPDCTNIGQSAFRDCSNISQINLPNCKNVYYGVFRGCTSLTDISLPKCELVGQYAFYGCSNISQISLPVVSLISGRAFENCSSLTSLTLCTDVYWTVSYDNTRLSNTPILSGTGSIYVRADKYNSWITSTGWSSLSARFVSVEMGIALSFGDGTVYGNTKVLNSSFKQYLGISSPDIQTLSLTFCDYIYQNAFDYCTNLQSISLPLCSYIDAWAFRSCAALQSVILPTCTYVSRDAFYGCTSLSYVSLPLCSYIGNTAFYAFGGVSMDLILGYPGVVTAGGAQPVDQRVNIYVPASLVETYKHAENWSYYSSKIFPIE